MWKATLRRIGAAVALPCRSMKLSELFPPETICVGLKQRTKPDLIEGLVRHAMTLGQVGREEYRLVIEKLLAREKLASTALGHGLALPHCQWSPLTRLVGVAGFLERGIPFGAADGGPVDGVFLVLSPPNNPEESFEVFGRLVALGRNSALRLLLRKCRTAAGVSAFFKEIDQPVSGHLDDLARVSLTQPEEKKRDPWRDLAFLSLTRHSHPDSGGNRSEGRWM